MSTKKVLMRGFPRALLVLVAIAPRAGLAQPITESFEELRRETVREFWRGDEPVVKEGDTIWITYLPAGQTESVEQEARVVGLTDSTITMTVGGGEIELPESRVSRIEWRRKESIVNGLFIGTAAGVGVGLLMAASVCEGGLFGADCETGTVYAALGGVGGAIGAGLGALADRSKKSPPLLIYRSPDPAGTSVSVSMAPLLSKHRKGVLFSIAW
jgi:hypothetical protein